MQEKKYRVVKIIDDMNIVINCGESDNISEGAKFNICSENGTMVEDPVTHECLGSFKGIKAKVEAVTVYEKMCVCQNSAKIGSFSGLNVLYNSLSGSRMSLNVDATQITGGLNASVNEPIQIGDEAELIDSGSI